MAEKDICRIVAYTAGGWQQESRRGGYCTIILLPHGKREQIVFTEPKKTTKTHMELTAALVALEYFAERTQLEIRSSSNYLISGVTESMQGWKDRNWSTDTDKPIPNFALWKRLDVLNSYHDVSWTLIGQFVRDSMNDTARGLANDAAAVPLVEA